MAEGIESAVQVDYLEAIGCQYGQGHHFARPRDPADIDGGLTRGDDTAQSSTAR